MTNKEEEKYQLTEFGVLCYVLGNYGFDYSKLTAKIGQHMLDDLIDGLMKIGYLPRLQLIKEE